MRGAPAHGIGLALGGGGARGLAHVAIVEAFDELGLRPAFIAGTSIGAMIGAAYAAGMDAAEMRDHVRSTLSSRLSALRRVLAERPGGVFDLFRFSPFASALLDGQRLVQITMPESLPDDFAQLEIPFMAVATDFYARAQAELTSGSLRQAIAASIALPGLITPQVVDGRILIDGGMVNPLPFEQVRARAAITVAVDVTGGPVGDGPEMPSRAELVFRSSQIMQHCIAAAALREHPVDIVITPQVDRFRVLEFFKADEILAEAAPAKEQLKRELGRLLDARQKIS